MSARDPVRYRMYMRAYMRVKAVAVRAGTSVRALRDVYPGATIEEIERAYCPPLSPRVSRKSPPPAAPVGEELPARIERHSPHSMPAFIWPGIWLRREVMR